MIMQPFDYAYFQIEPNSYYHEIIGTDLNEMDPNKYNYDYELFVHTKGCRSVRYQKKLWMMNFVDYMMYQWIRRNYVSLKAQWMS